MERLHSKRFTGSETWDGWPEFRSTVMTGIPSLGYLSLSASCPAIAIRMECPFWKTVEIGNMVMATSAISHGTSGRASSFMFSCRTRGFCPSCHAKRVEEWGEWMRETLLLDVPHRQVVFTIPKRLRIFFRYNRRLLGSLCRSALRALSRYFEIVTGSALRPGIIAVLQTFGDRISLHVHLHFLVMEGGVDEAGVSLTQPPFLDNLQPSS